MDAVRSEELAVTLHRQSTILFWQVSGEVSETGWRLFGHFTSPNGGPVLLHFSCGECALRIPDASGEISQIRDPTPSRCVTKSEPH